MAKLRNLDVGLCAPSDSLITVSGAVGLKTKVHYHPFLMLYTGGDISVVSVLSVGIFPQINPLIPQAWAPHVL